MKSFHVGSHQFRESLWELLRELWLSYCSSRGMLFREWNFVFRELLREYPETLRELREWPFHSESGVPEIGVVPRLLITGVSQWAFSRRQGLSQVCFGHFLDPVAGRLGRLDSWKGRVGSQNSSGSTVGQEKGGQTQTLWFRWGECLPREGVGA